MPKVKTKSEQKGLNLQVLEKLKEKMLKNHILTKKETKQKKNLTKTSIVNKSDEKNIKKNDLNLLLCLDREIM